MFENSTRLNRNHLVCIARIRVKTPLMTAYRIGLVLFALLFIAFGVTEPEIMNKVIDFLLAVVFVLMAAWFFPAILLTRMLRAVNFDDIRSYKIDDAGVTAMVKGPGVTATDTIAFDRFDQVVVGRDALYLRMGAAKQYLVLDNAGFTKGTAEECARFLETKGLRGVWSNAH